MNKDHYQQLALPPTPRNLRKRHPRNSEIDQHIDELKSLVDDIETNELREKMKQTMEKITYSWSKKHDSLIDALARLEKSQKRTQVRLSSQALQYERAIRDVQAYRTRYENCVLLKRQTSSGSNPKNFRRRSAIALSNGSSLSGKSITSTQSSPRSSSSSTPTTFSFMDDIIDSVNYNSEVDEELSLDLCSDQETPFTATPSSPPPSSYNDTDSLISREDQQFIFSAASCEDNQENVLKFGCGEGFWDTIANSRTNKQEVDELIR
jgi:hypothetical protein